MYLSDKEIRNGGVNGKMFWWLLNEFFRNIILKWLIFMLLIFKSLCFNFIYYVNLINLYLILWIL